MLKSLLVLVLITWSPAPQQQSPPREEPDLVAVNFSWAKVRQNAGLIRGAQNPGGPITTPIADNRDLESRKSDLRTMEKKAAVSADHDGNTYHLRLELKNTGTHVVKNLIWEFRPTAMPAGYEPKQYLCLLRIKPKEKKILDLWTPYAPVKVVNANVRLEGLEDGDVVINKIEYKDGSVWTRRGWNISLPADATQTLSEGECSVF